MSIQSCPLIAFGETTPELSSQSQNNIQPQNNSGWRHQPQNVLVFGGLHHAPEVKTLWVLTVDWNSQSP